MKLFQAASDKISWSDKLILEHRNAIRSFVEDGGVRVRLDKSKETGTWVTRVSTSASMPYQIPCTFADACANLRSVIDFCWKDVGRLCAADVRQFKIQRDKSGLIKEIRRYFKNKQIARDLDDILVNSFSVFHRKSGGNPIIGYLNDVRNEQMHSLLIPITQVAEFAAGTKIMSSDGSEVYCGGARFGDFSLSMAGDSAQIIPEIGHKIEFYLSYKDQRNDVNTVDTLLSFRSEVYDILRSFERTFGC